MQSNPPAACACLCACLLLQNDKYKSGAGNETEVFPIIGKPIKFAVTRDAKACMLVYEGVVAFTHMVSFGASSVWLLPCGSPCNGTAACTATPAARTLLLLPMVLLTTLVRQGQCLKSQPCGTSTELAALSEEQHSTPHTGEQLSQLVCFCTSHPLHWAVCWPNSAMHANCACVAAAAGAHDHPEQ